MFIVILCILDHNYYLSRKAPCVFSHSSHYALQGVTRAFVSEQVTLFICTAEMVSLWRFPPSHPYFNNFSPNNLHVFWTVLSYTRPIHVPWVLPTASNRTASDNSVYSDLYVCRLICMLSSLIYLQSNLSLGRQMDARKDAFSYFLPLMNELTKSRIREATGHEPGLS